MKSKFHGIFSFTLMSLSYLLAIVIVYNSSVNFALLYILVIFVSSFLIVYSFCTKCACRGKGCAHLLPGKLAGLLPKREQGEYSKLDIVGTIVGIAAIISFPQYWLWQQKIVFVVFWVVQIIAVLEVKCFVCGQCENHICVFK